MQTTEFVDLPKIAPIPPVAMMMASAGKVRTSIERKSMAQMPRQCRCCRGQRKGTPSLILFDLAFRLVAAYLFVERIKKLLARGSAGKGSAVVQRAAEATEIEQTFGSAIEGNSHAVEQVDDAGSRFAHRLDWRLIGEKVAAVDGVVEVLPGRIAFALQVLGGIDAALCAHGVRAFYRHDGKKVNLRRPSPRS